MKKEIIYKFKNELVYILQQRQSKLYALEM